MANQASRSVGGVGSRREARERARALLYEAEARSATPAEVVAGLPLVPVEFCVDVVLGVGTHSASIDELIRRFARDWKLERMPWVDRTLLRMACYELAHRPDVPTNAVINEAVDLAKQYSTEESGRFLNGMLSSIAGEVRGEEVGGA
ncbi:hypothetical protein BH24ACT3_BH24ACT3_11180 [soil metagenome]